MINAKRRKLVARGWKVGDAAEFVGLTDEERAYVDLKVRLADGVRRQRQEHGLTQVALAEALHSSQSRVAKLEAGDPTVSLDLMIRCLLALGVSRQGLARIIEAGARRAN